MDNLHYSFQRLNPVKGAFMKNGKKGFVLASAAAALLATPFVTTPSFAKPMMVRCVMSNGNGCSSGCPQKKVEVMSLEECKRAGGMPEPMEEAALEPKYEDQTGQSGQDTQGSQGSQNSQDSQSGGQSSGSSDQNQSY